MRPERRMAAVFAAALAVVLAGAGTYSWYRHHHVVPNRIRNQIAALEADRDRLRLRRDALLDSDPRLKALPDQAVRIGVPDTLVRGFIERVVTDLVNGATLELDNLTFRRTGSITKVVRVGDYHVRVTVGKTVCRLKASPPTISFAPDGVSVSLPVSVVAGAGRAKVDVDWDSRGLANIVCRDTRFSEVVAGTLRPDTYVLSGSLAISRTPTRLVMTPKIPPRRITIRVDPSEEAWAAVEKVIDDKSGVCGFALDRVNVLTPLRDRLARGFTVRLPMERIRPVTLPIGIEPTIPVRGRPLPLNVSLEKLVYTGGLIWLGVDVKSLPSLPPQDSAPPPLPRGGGA
jgi:hypothetical protein